MFPSIHRGLSAVVGTTYLTLKQNSKPGLQLGLCDNNKLIIAIKITVVIMIITCVNNNIHYYAIS